MGLASAIVPVAVLIHLIAEISAISVQPNLAGFFGRHVYLLLPLLLGAWFFCSTIGVGRSSAERIRRCAIARAHIVRADRVRGFGHVFAANMLFFGLTQALEGVPIVAGSVSLGILVAALSSLLAAFALSACRRRFADTLRALVAGSRNRLALVACAKIAVSLATRTAAASFSLFIPNRPPPQSPFFINIRF